MEVCWDSPVSPGSWVMLSISELSHGPWMSTLPVSSYYLQKNYLKLGRMLLLPILKLSITLVSMGSDICNNYYGQKWICGFDFHVSIVSAGRKAWWGWTGRGSGDQWGRRGHLRQWSPTILTPRTGFMKDKFSMGQARGSGFRMIQMHYIYCHSFLLLLRQLHLIRSQRLGAPDLRVTQFFVMIL